MGAPILPIALCCCSPSVHAAVALVETPAGCVTDTSSPVRNAMSTCTRPMFDPMGSPQEQATHGEQRGTAPKNLSSPHWVVHEGFITRKQQHQNTTNAQVHRPHTARSEPSCNTRLNRPYRFVLGQLCHVLHGIIRGKAQKGCQSTDTQVLVITSKHPDHQFTSAVGNCAMY
jgi:hypothetical protein